jgi:hypothetical protein
LFFCNFVFAESFVVPEQKIVGAEVPIALGDLVDLSVSPIQNPPKFLVSTVYSWKVFDGYAEKRIRNYENGIFFGSGIQNKRLKVIVSITHLYVVKEGDKLVETAIRTNFISTDIFIGEEEPDVPPSPEIEPEFTDSKYQLSKFIYDGLKPVKLSKLDKIKQCTAIASSFDSIAAAIAAGTTTNSIDVASIVDSLMKSETTKFDQAAKKITQQELVVSNLASVKSKISVLQTALNTFEDKSITQSLISDDEENFNFVKIVLYLKYWV